MFKLIGSQNMKAAQRICLPFLLLVTVMFGCAGPGGNTNAHSAYADRDIPALLIGTEGRQLPEPPQPYDTLRLAILPDRTTGRPWGMRYLYRGMEDLRRTQPDAFFTIGDHVQGYTRDLQKYASDAREFLDALSSTGIPFYPTPGNHDIISGSRQHGDYTFSRLYEQYFGPRYYAVDFGLACVIVLNTEDLASSEDPPIFSTEQIAFLDEALSNAVRAGVPTFVLMHRPAWRYRKSNFMKDIHPRLVAAGVKAVIAGHYHSMQRDNDIDGIQYHILAVCGAMIDQSPLTGQINHLTYLTVRSDGSFNIYHSPVGHTLPDDWIAAEDQQRAFRLKSRAADQFTALPQPITAPSAGTVWVTIRNPIDVPVTFTASLVTEFPEPEPVAGEFFVSETERDIFSPYNTDADTPFRRTSAPTRMILGPGDETQLSMGLAADPQGRMIPPPEIHLRAVFTDSKGRLVPVVIRRRVPLQMDVDTSAGEVGGLLTWAWRTSVYDNDEPGATFALSRNGNDLYIALQVPDDVVSINDEAVDPATKLNNPSEDAVVLYVSGTRYLVDPFAEEGNRVFEVIGKGEDIQLQPTDRVACTARQTPDGYGLRMILSDLEFPVRFDLRVADNDDGYFTQWRQFSAPWLKPAGVEVR